jgi:hypothetical protein
MEEIKPRVGTCPKCPLLDPNDEDCSACNLVKMGQGF